jgi:hypothetical protein
MSKAFLALEGPSPVSVIDAVTTVLREKEKERKKVFELHPVKFSICCTSYIKRESPSESSQAY